MATTALPLPPPTNKTILITGINGYIASHLGLALLKAGYTVHGTSRSPQTSTHLLSPTGAFAGFTSRYTHHTIPDITIPGAFDTAVSAVHAILHTASPLDFSLRTVDGFLLPAVQGNLSILNSTLHHSPPSFQSFILLSSNAAIGDRPRLPATHAYTEADWNESALALARASEASTGPFLPQAAYSASKTAAERALWAWRDTHHPRWSISAVNPSVVTGPPVSWPPHPHLLNETLLPLWRIFSGEAATIPAGLGSMSYVDVRDVVRLHMWCLTHPAACDGERYLCTSGKGTMQAVADILRRAYPARTIVVGNPGCDYREGDYWFVEGESSMVSTKAYRAMGVERFEVGFEKSVLDTVRAFEERWGDLLRNK